MSLKPYIDGGVVKKIEVGGWVIPARNTGVPISDLAQIIEAFNLLMKYFDFESIGTVKEEEKEWSREEIFDFLNERNKRQILFFRILSENEQIDRDALIKRMAKELKKPDFDGRTLAGSLAGIGIRTNALEKEPLYGKNWVEEDDEWVCYYKLSPSYAPIIKEWLEEEE